MIHQYINNGYNIVLDVNSGSVHVVDPLSYELIALADKRLEEGRSEEEILTEAKEQFKDQYSEEDITEALGEIWELKELGQLFAPDIYENYIFDFKKRQTVVKALCLHIAHDCNLACRYCFAEEGEYHGRRALMSFEVGKKALDFLVANSGNRVNLEVDFFGGEPLMNWQVVKDLVEYGRSLEEPNHKKFRFTLTTNGVLLNDDILEFVNKEMSNVVLSIDGRKEVNDKMRPFRKGQGSYDLIVPKFQKVAESRDQMNYYVRGTFTKYNLDFAYFTVSTTVSHAIKGSPPKKSTSRFSLLALCFIRKSIALLPVSGFISILSPPKSPVWAKQYLHLKLQSWETCRHIALIGAFIAIAAYCS